MLKRLFWFCSGVNTKLLALCPTEHNKYAGIGAGVLGTALCAFAAGAYVFYIMFRSPVPAVLLGLPWAVVVFVLDRQTVSGLKPSGRRGRDAINLLPRIILALIISWSVIRPLELRLFEMEMFGPVNDLERAAQEEIGGRIRARYQLKIDILDLEIERTRDAIGNKAPLVEAGVGSESSRRSYLKLLPDLERKRRELVRAQSEAARAHDALIAEHEGNRLYRLTSKLQALAYVLDEAPFLELMHWFLVLMFAGLKSAPLLMFLMTGKGPYDELIEVHDEVARFREIREMLRGGRRQR